ncbi:MAG: Histidinol-phosphatase [Desulfovibrio sp.]
MSVTVDLHSHSLYSHARDSVEAMAASAYAKGLKIFGFSEHSPRPDGYAYPKDYQEQLVAGFPDYVAEVLAERERYAGRMDVLLALEMDYMPAEEAYAAQCVAAYPYDYVIGGLHFLGTWGFDWSLAEWEGLSEQTKREHFIRYYRDLRSMAECRLFHIAAHPDLVKLFCKESFAAWVKEDEAKGHIRAALAAMKDAGMVMEISSAAIRKGLGEPYPCREVMALARELDVPISFGSDAHATEDVAYEFDTLAAYAKEYGYAKSAVFYEKELSFREF